MEEKLVVLKLFLDELGIPDSIDTVDERKRIQKAAYLGQLSGVDLGYRYGWYKMGPYRIGPSYYLYFFWSWIIQVDIDDVVDPARPNQKFDAWACIKLEGPGFPHGKAGQKNAICVERVVLVKSP